MKVPADEAAHPPVSYCAENTKGTETTDPSLDGETAFAAVSVRVRQSRKLIPPLASADRTVPSGDGQ